MGKKSKSKKSKVQKRDTEMFIPGKRNHPFPDNSTPRPKIINVKPYRSTPRIQEVHAGGEIEMVIKRANPKPKIMIFIDKDKMNKRILKNPQKHTRII